VPTNRQPSLDDIDRSLIASLRADSRTPVAHLAKRVGLSRAAVQNRINRLIGDGVILGFTLRLPPHSEPHRVRAIMAIAVEGLRSRDVTSALGGVPEVGAVHTTSGRWDLIAELEAESLEAFSRALDHIREIKGITTTETSLLLETRRF
jgi:DNA-binding Lrp family transcriptional regulator